MGHRNSLKQALVLTSGGIDSAACAFLLKSSGFRVRGFFVDFNQAARRQEESACRNMLRVLNVPFSKCIVRIPSSKYRAGEIKGRNAFLVMTALLSNQIDRGVVALGIHSGTPYFDCSPRFLRQLDLLVQNYSSGLVSVVAPFLSWKKGDIVNYFRDNELPITKTYSCETGSVPPCGKCLSCRDRRILKI